MHSEAQEVAENCLGAPQLPTTQWKSHILLKASKTNLSDTRNRF
jgi:hypothetical protein